MFETVKGIVLHTIKYNDKSSIVHIFSDLYGHLSLSVPISSGKRGGQRRVLFMPLSIIEMQINHNPAREIQSSHETRALVALHNLHTDPAKNAIALFITELLSHILREPEPNTALFEYMFHTVQMLDKWTEHSIANFHICYLINLGSFLGIQPNVETYAKGRFFDMENGIFTQFPTSNNHILKPEQAEVLKNLTRMHFTNMHLFHFSRTERNEVLNMILDYYRLHQSTIGTLKSPEVLKSLFI